MSQYTLDLPRTSDRLKVIQSRSRAVVALNEMSRMALVHGKRQVRNTFGESSDSGILRRLITLDILGDIDYDNDTSPCVGLRPQQGFVISGDY